MKYWLLTTEFPPQFGGGIGTYCAQWSRILQKKESEVTVFLPNRNVKKFSLKFLNGVRIVEFSPYYKNTSGYLGYETMISYSFAEIVKDFALKEGKPEWIEAQEYNGIAYYLLQRKHLGEALFRDLKVLITCHAPSFLYFEFNHINHFKLPYFWIGEMEKYVIQAADVCISPSHYLVDRLKERHQFNREIFVLHNPFDFEKEKITNPISENKAVFLAKLSPSKGILETVKTFKKLWQNGHKFKLQLIGDKDYFYHARNCLMGSYLQQQYGKFIESGLLEITGSLPPEKLSEAISTSKVVLVPSKVDNFPYTVVECMAAGKLVLASKHGGQQEIIQDGVNGFLFDHYEPGSFEEKLLEVFGLEQKLTEKICKNAIRTIEEVCNAEAYFQNKLKILNAFSEKPSSDCQEFIFTRQIPEQNQYVSDTSEEPVKGLLSVVIPFYNLGKYLPETISSVQISSYKNLEILVINDGSDDPESLRILDKLQVEQSVQIISQQNKGLAEARNTGALKARGEFLAFLDADDTVLPEYFLKAISVLQQKTNVHFVGSWVQYFEGSNNIWPAFNPEPPYLLYHNMVNSSGLVYKRNSFLEAGLNDSEFIYGMEDYDSVISMVSKGKWGVVIPEILFNYRVRKNSMARGFNYENKSFLYQLLSKKHRSLYQLYGPEISNLLNANGPGFMIENPTLDYHLYGGSSFKSRVLRKAYSLIKQQPFLRRMALAGYQKFNFSK